MMPAVRTAAAALCATLAASVAAAQPVPSSKTLFPEGARVAFVNVDYVFASTREGKAAATELQALQNKKTADLSARTKAVEALQQKLAQTGAAMNDEARGRLERDVARARIDFQRLVEDSESEVQELRQQFQRAFSRRLFPLIGEVAKERDLWAVFNIGESTLLWHQPALDISDEIVARLDGAAKPPAPAR